MLCVVVGHHRISSTSETRSRWREDNLSVLINLPAKSDIVLEVVDVLGQILKSEHLGSLSGHVKKQLAIDNFENGIYFLRVIIDNQTLTSKFIKQ